MDWETSLKLGLVLLVIAVIVFGPYAFIWSVNTIFELGIDWTWKHWFAVHGLFLFVNSSRATGD